MTAMPMEAASLVDKLAALEGRYEELGKQLADPEVLSDQTSLPKTAKAHAELAPIVEKYREYKQATEDLAGAHALLDDRATDADLRELAQEEAAQLKERLRELEEEIQVLLLPKDPYDEKSVIVEIRAGAGGDEAALFAGNLMRMYVRHAERNNWRVEMLSSNETGIGGFKEVIFMVHGRRAYSRLKFESGVHRVQRVPVTEASGRIHTSTATVAVLPEAEEVEIDINPNDLRIDVYRSTGHGGQSVNTTDSAVRITHLPTGMVVTCQDEKSQLKNKEKALRILRARLLQKAEDEQQKALAEDRKSQVGTGDRSERIRTYNFPQGRITDHRIGMTIYQLNQFLDGDIDEVVSALTAADQAERLKNLQ